MPDEAELHERVRDVTGVAGPGSTNPDDVIQRGVLGLDHPLLQAAPQAIYAIDLGGRVVAWNRRAEEVFGWSADEVIGQLVPIIDEEDLEISLDRIAKMLADDEPLQGEFSPTHRDGSRLAVLVSSAVLRDHDGEAVGVLVFAVDVTAERRDRAALEASESRWRTLLDNISDTVTVTDAEGRLLQATGRRSDVVDTAESTWQGIDVFALVHPDEVGRARELVAELVAAPGTTRRAELRMRDLTSDGWEIIDITGANALDDPDIGGLIFTSRNVTQQRASERLLVDEADVLELIARGSPLSRTLRAVGDMVARHADGLVVLGVYEQPDIDEPPIEPTISPEDSAPPGFLESIGRADHSRFYEGTVPRGEITVIPDVETIGADRPEIRPLVEAGYRSGVITPLVPADDGDVLGSLTVIFEGNREPEAHLMKVLAVASQLAGIAIERHRAERDLTHQALHDQLTGLPNRRLVMEALDRALANPVRRGPVAVMLLDLDRFKVINDSLGHTVGDRLLCEFGRRLSSIVRPGDVVGRFEGDEFVVVLPEVADLNDIRSVANRLDLALSEPFSTDDGDVVLSASLGTALSTGTETGDDLLKHADTAVFRAKDLGGARLEVFDDELRTKADRRLKLERDLRAAIEQSELVVHYQPKIALNSGRIIGVEALLRWQHPEQGLVYPGEFIGLSEETGLIVRIGRWVLEEAVHQARTLADRMSDRVPLIVSVNLSARQLSSPNLVRNLGATLLRYGWPPGRLQLEVTESLLINDTDARLSILEELHALGVKLAIDDFGTGFSSLSYLHRFPVDVIKIDRSFVSSVRADGTGSSVTRAIIHLAHDLGLIVVAEGVETTDQLEGLRRLGCDWAQGFLFAKGLPSEGLTELLRVDPVW